MLARQAPSRASDWYITAAALIILLVGFALRITALEQFPPGISSDEAVNAIDAFHIAQTGKFPLYQDFGRPDPLYRVVQAIGVALYGSSVWAIRLTSAFVGIITLAVAYATVQIIFRKTSRLIRQSAALAAMIVPAISMGHIVITRSTYRGAPIPIFIMLSILFYVRGYQSGRRLNFVISGVFIAGALYTYTAAFVLPLAFALLIPWLLVFRRVQFAREVLHLVIVGGTVLLLTLPISFRLIVQPETVLGRAGDVAAESSPLTRLQTMIDQFFVQGDENPQYNVASAPLIPPAIAPLFLIGLVALLFRLNQPASLLILSLLILTALPAYISNEITHGLRVFGEYGVIPLVCAAGVIGVLSVIPVPQIKRMVPLALVLATLALSTGVWNVYTDFWQQPQNWRRWAVYGMELDHGEWFFRTDQLDLAEWIEDQTHPIILPASQINQSTTRVHLMDSFPDVRIGDTTEANSLNPIFLIPFALEQEGYANLRGPMALLHDRSILLLPPLAEKSVMQARTALENAEAVRRNRGLINPIAKIIQLNEPLEFREATTLPEPINFGDEIYLSAIDTPDTLSPESPTNVDVTLYWQAARTIGFDYNAFVQLLTQDFQRVAGDEHAIQRWLHPTTRWDTTQQVPDTYSLDVPALAPGAYRLVTGIYPVFGNRITVQNAPEGLPDDFGIIRWIKVPQIEQPNVPPHTRLDSQVVLGESFQLVGAEAQRVPNMGINITLYWQNLSERPGIDATIFVHAFDATGEIVAQSDKRPWNGTYPTFIWSEEEVISTQHILPLIETVDYSELRVRVGMYTLPGPQNLSMNIDGDEAPGSVIVLGSLQDILNRTESAPVEENAG